MDETNLEFLSQPDLGFTPVLGHELEKATSGLFGSASECGQVSGILLLMLIFSLSFNILQYVRANKLFDQMLVIIPQAITEIKEAVNEFKETINETIEKLK